MDSNFTVDKGVVTIYGTTQEMPVQIYEFRGVNCTVAIPQKRKMNVAPEEYLALLDIVPNRAIIDQLIILDEPVSAAAHLTGEVDCIVDLRRLYLVSPTGNSESTLRAMLHGWAHVAYLDCKVEAHAFGLACKIEAPDLTDDAEVIESWCDLLTDLLMIDSADHVKTIGTTMPLRAMALCLALRRLLDQTVNGRSSRHDQFERILASLKELAASRAASEIRARIKEQAGEQNIALRLFFHFGVEDNQLLSELRIIDLSFELLGEKKLSLLQYATNVEYLDLSGTGLTKNGLTLLAGLKKLIDLKVAHTEVKYVGYLGTPPELSRLDLAATRVGDTDIAAVRDWPKLQELDLQFTSVTDVGVKALQHSAPRIKITR